MSRNYCTWGFNEPYGSQSTLFDWPIRWSGRFRIETETIQHNAAIGGLPCTVPETTRRIFTNLVWPHRISSIRRLKISRSASWDSHFAPSLPYRSSGIPIASSPPSQTSDPVAPFDTEASLSSLSVPLFSRFDSQSRVGTGGGDGERRSNLDVFGHRSERLGSLIQCESSWGRVGSGIEGRCGGRRPSSGARRGGASPVGCGRYLGSLSSWGWFSSSFSTARTSTPRLCRYDLC